MKYFKFVVLVSISVALYGCAVENYPADGSGALKTESSKYEKIVKVNDIEFRLKVYGHGDVTVIFESGIGLPLETWYSIDDSTANYAKVFLYDRAGIGKSSLSLLPRTVPNYIRELRSLLNYENISPPYVFVAHSMGGYIARYYSWKYPQEVSGVLLVDPAPETMYDSMSKEELKKYLAKGDDYYSKKDRGRQLEWDYLYSNRKYMYDIETSIPVIVLSSSEGNMAKYHKQIYEKWENSKIVEVDGSHFIHNEHPEMIVEYIKAILFDLK